ncbi:centriole proteome [Chlorella sorokiniana]|uniref:Centrosomal protein POC5 n=1 Tax=Chlorella sorokiniana TaxID=3076 RepID=A0A2P6TG30_CHLSO|nr:centriole proteome [Chlorella sorokiniana]|eukprot:PRW33073.1 centriole proteome [Chlorella sorokiniana]
MSEGAHPDPAEPAAALQEIVITNGRQRPGEGTPTRAGASAAALGAAEVAPCSPAAADRYSDADLDGLALKLDAHSRQLRADLLAHLADCQRRAEERQREAVAAVASSAARELAAKEQELARTAAELERQREILRRTGGALFKAARWRRQHTLGCMAWRAWRERAARQGRVKAVAATVNEYDERRRQRGAFHAWRTEAASQLRLRVKAQAAAALQEERARIWEESHASGAQQAKRLAEVEAALAAALEERARLEENMK